MAEKLAKTNAIRLLESRKVWYIPYVYDPTIHSADGVAAALGLNPAEVYKTLVMTRTRGQMLLVMAPATGEVDLRVVARAIGEKSLDMVSQREAERSTGLLVGGIGALALTNKPFDVLIDDDAMSHESILVNGGRRGLNVRVRVADLVALTEARPVPLR